MFWTDSQSVLMYIANEHSRYKTFVANRVATIRDATKLSQWNYINSKSNPADDATRGQNANKFINRRWLSGPDILWKGKEEQQKYLVNFKETIPISQDDPEVKRTHTVNAICTKEENATQKLMTHFSEWTKLLIAVAWYLKLKESLKTLALKRKLSENKMITRSKIKDLPDVTLGGQQIRLEDLKRAEMAIVQYTTSVLPE